MNKVLNIGCVVCGKEFSVEMSTSEYAQWKSGVEIQKVLPNMHPMNRESLITHMCVDCLSKIYNCPKPGEDWGEPTECYYCGCSVYPKDNGKCPSCGSEVLDV